MSRDDVLVVVRGNRADFIDQTLRRGRGKRLTGDEVQRLRIDFFGTGRRCAEHKKKPEQERAIIIPPQPRATLTEDMISPTNSI